MTKQLRFTSLLLLITSLTFAQQNKEKPIDSTKATNRSSYELPRGSFGGDKMVADTTKKPTKSKHTLKFGSSDIRRAVSDSTKTPVTTTEQARTAQVNPPIKGVGVVVKKNPGGGASKVGATNDKGEVVFTIKEKGDYTITLSNDGGGAATSNNNAAAKSQGVDDGVKGVKVALGKNCPPYVCNTSYTTANEKGQVEFKNVEVGTYTLLVQVPCPFGHEWKDGKCVQVGDKTNNPIKQN